MSKTRQKRPIRIYAKPPEVAIQRGLTDDVPEQATLEIPNKTKGSATDLARELFAEQPVSLTDDRVAMILYWTMYDHLELVLGDRYEVFTRWFLDASKATHPETIRRRRAESPWRDQVSEGVRKHRDHMARHGRLSQ